MYCITDSRLIQVNLERVKNLINRLKVKGKATADKQAAQVMAAERAAIVEELQCKDRDPQVTSRLIESLTRVINAADGKPYTTPAWLSSTKSPGLQIVKTILNSLHKEWTRKKRERPGRAARARSARAEGKQAQVEEGDDEEGDDEDPTAVNDNKDPIVVIDD